MTHFLVSQLKFAKQSWLRGLEGLSAADAEQRLANNNSISWMVAHLAQFDQMAWLDAPVNTAVEACRWGQPASIPDYAEMRAAWDAINAVVEPKLATFTDAEIFGPSRHPSENAAMVLQRQTWHYWFHLGEMSSIRQSLGHTGLPQYIGRIDPEAYFPSE